MGVNVDKAILNESLLEKNIGQIKFYAIEEKKALKKICNQLNEFNDSYNSSNFNDFLNSINKLKVKIDFIYEKRIKYVKILNKVISKYKTLSRQTVRNFDKGV